MNKIGKHNKSESCLSNAEQLLELARDWMKQGNTNVAYQLLQDANRSKEIEKNKVIKGEISKEIGRVFMSTGNWEQAENAYRRATEIFLEQEYYKGAAESTRNLANLKFQKGQFNDSNSLCEQAIAWATNSGDFQLRATIFNTQGAIHSIEGRQRESIKTLNLCLSDFRRAGNSLRQAYVEHNIGLAYLELDDPTEAKKSLEGALAKALENTDINLVEMCYQNIAKVYIKLKDFVSARSLIRTARELLDNLKSPNLEADLNVIEAECLRFSGDFDRADDLLNKALTIARKADLLQNEAEILFEAGQVAFERGDFNLGRSRVEAAIELFKKTGGGQINKAIEKLKYFEFVAKKGNKG
ncbi:MAG: hypothetical protein ABIJ45_06955 [Candidatus Zixiibacteriota bacterium]